MRCARTDAQTSVWHFGWHPPNSREYNERFRKMGLEVAIELVEVK